MKVGFQKSSITNIPSFQTIIPSFQMYFLNFHTHNTAIIFILIISTSDSRLWEVTRENGNKEMCCFCSHKSLKTKEHIIPECEKKLGMMHFSGYVGPPICSCQASQRYPNCPLTENVCGHNIKCPRRKVYETCLTNELYQNKMMTCNESLQWTYDIIDCNNICTLSNKIENGFVSCMEFGSKAACNITCKNGFYAAQTKYLSCAEAKNSTCLANAKTNNGIITNSIIFIMIFISLILVVVICVVRRKMAKHSQVNDPNNIEMGPLDSERGNLLGNSRGNLVVHGHGNIIVNGHGNVIANGQIANGQIGQNDEDNENGQTGSTLFVGPTSYDPHRVGPTSYDPHSVGPSSPDSHTVGPTSYDPHRVGPSSPDSHTVGPTSYDPHSDDDGPRGFQPENPESLQSFMPYHMDTQPKSYVGESQETEEHHPIEETQASPESHDYTVATEEQGPHFPEEHVHL